TGPFSATNQISLYANSDLVVNLDYHNDDVASSTVYSAHFTTTVATSPAFGPAHVIDSRDFDGGEGLSTGGSFHVLLHASNNSALQGIVIKITSDITGSTVIGKCDFLLDQLAIDNDIDKDGIP